MKQKTANTTKTKNGIARGSYTAQAEMPSAYPSPSFNEKEGKYIRKEEMHL